MANPRLLQAIINRFSKGSGDSSKLSGLSEVIPEPATKPVPPKGSVGPGPEFEHVEDVIPGRLTKEETRKPNQFQEAFREEIELDPTKPRPSTFDLRPKVFEDVPPIQPDIGGPRPQRPTTAIELRGRDARVEARGTNPPSEVDEAANKVFDQIQDLEDALSLPPSSSQADRKALGVSKKLLQNFKREASQTAAEARKTNNPALLQAILDRLTK